MRIRMCGELLGDISMANPSADPRPPSSQPILAADRLIAPGRAPAPPAGGAGGGTAPPPLPSPASSAFLSPAPSRSTWAAPRRAEGECGAGGCSQGTVTPVVPMENGGSAVDVSQPGEAPGEGGCWTSRARGFAWPRLAGQGSAPGTNRGSR